MYYEKRIYLGSRYILKNVTGYKLLNMSGMHAVDYLETSCTVERQEITQKSTSTGTHLKSKTNATKD